MTSALVLAGGWAHPAQMTGPPTAEALTAFGLDVTVVDELEAVAAALEAGATDLLVVHTCRFLMRDARYSEAQRAEYASVTSPAVRATIAGHVAAGRPVLALHTAVLCFDDWPEWSELVGGTWDWARSNHPPPGPFVVVPEPAHPVTAGLAPFEVVDELYRFVGPAPGAQVVATAVDAEGITHPLAWVHDTGGARVAYDSLGHDRRSLADPGHRAFLGRLVGWLTA